MSVKIRKEEKPFTENLKRSLNKFRQVERDTQDKIESIEKVLHIFEMDPEIEKKFNDLSIIL